MCCRPVSWPPDSGGTGEDFTDTIAELRTEQHDAVDFASDGFEADAGDEIVKAGGDDAYVRPISGAMEEGSC